MTCVSPFSTLATDDTSPPPPRSRLLPHLSCATATCLAASAARGRAALGRDASDDCVAYVFCCADAAADGAIALRAISSILWLRRDKTETRGDTSHSKTRADTSHSKTRGDTYIDDQGLRVT